MRFFLSLYHIYYHIRNQARYFKRHPSLIFIGCISLLYMGFDIYADEGFGLNFFVMYGFYVWAHVAIFLLLPNITTKED